MTNMYKIIRLPIILAIISLYISIQAQTFIPVQVTGFNHDIIAEGAGGMNRAEATTSTTFDDNAVSLTSDNVLYTKNFRGNANLSSPPPFGLPDDGIITSVNLPGAVYHLASYSGNNALVLRQQNTSGTLTLEIPGVFSKIAFLGASSNGASTFNFILNFSDGTSYPTTFSVPDWFDGSNFAIKSIGRVYRRAIGGHQADQFNGDAENPRLYDNQITIPAPFDQKILTSITITKTSSGGSTGIFAINGITPINAPLAPVATAATNINGTNFTANWLSVPGATTYYLDVSTSSTFSTLVPTFNNRNVGNVQSFNATGLSGAPIYYYRVRAGNAGGISASSNTVQVILQQCPAGNYIVNRQAQVDSFKILYPTCTKISGSLGTTSNTSITNVNGFSNIDSITNELVITNNGLLSDLDGFKKLKYVGTGIAIGANSILGTIQSFDNLEKTPVLNFGFNGQLKVIDGFPKLNATNIILVENNPELISINFTSNLSTVNNFIAIKNNPKLSGIKSLGGAKSINEYLLLENNISLTDLTGINTATFIKSINIISNPSINNLNALNAVTNIDGRIFIQNNQTLQDITGLKNINPATIKGEGLVITNNPALSVCNLPNICTYLQGAGARNISGNAGDCISEIAVKNMCLPPIAPTALPATNITATGFTANWNMVANATNYFIDVSTDSTFNTYLIGYNNLDVGNVLTLNISGIPDATLYYYRVRASNNSGNSPNSNIIQVKASDIKSVLVSGFNYDLIANGSGTNQAMASTTNELSSFVLYSKDFRGNGNPNTAPPFGLPINGIIINDALPGYDYQLASYNGNNAIILKSINESDTLILTQPDKYSKISFLATSANGATGISAVLNFSDGSTTSMNFTIADWYNNQSFAIKGIGRLSRNFDGFSGDADNPRLSNFVFTLPSTYDEKAVTSVTFTKNQGGIAVILAMTGLVNKIPSIPEALTATNVTSSGFTANWNPAPDATNYVIDVSLDANFSTFVSVYNNSSVGNVQSVNVTGLSSNTKYYYRVRANNVAGTSPNSNVITVITQNIIPIAPTALAATDVTSSGFTANWNVVSNANGYFIDVSLNSNFTNFVSGYNNQSVGNTQSLNVTGLSNNTTYFYRIRAGNSAGLGPNSNVITVLTNNEIPAAPQALAATNVTSSGFTANWNVVSNASDYFIDVSLNSNFTNFVSGYNSQSAGNAQSIYVTGLSNNTTYFYRVRAGNSGGPGPNSNVIQQKTLDEISEPCNEWIEMVNSNFLVSSTACSGDSIHFIDYSNLEIEDGAVFSWDYGDGNNSKERDPIYTYKQTGEYTVSLQISNTACAGIKVSKDINILGCRKGAISDLGFTSVYPTPNNGDFSLDIKLPESSPIGIKIFNSDGKVVQQYSYKDIVTLTHQFTLDKTGMYYIEVIHKFGLEATRTIVIK